MTELVELAGGSEAKLVNLNQRVAGTVVHSLARSAKLVTCGEHPIHAVEFRCKNAPGFIYGFSTVSGAIIGVVARIAIFVLNAGQRAVFIPGVYGGAPQGRGNLL